MGVPYFTSKEIKKNRELLFQRSGKSTYWIKKRKIINYVKNNFSHDIHILDIGCAHGEMMKQFLQEGLDNLSGVDIDDYLRFPELKKRLRFADLNSENLPFEDSSMDVITALQTMEHLENPFHFIRECKRVLKAEGTLVLAIPNGNTIWDKLRFFTQGNLINYNLNNNHISFLTRDVFQKTVLNHFRIKEIFYGLSWTPWVRPRRITKRFKELLPPCRLWSCDICYILKKRKHAVK